jgi:hypothetical protein
VVPPFPSVTGQHFWSLDNFQVQLAHHQLWGLVMNLPSELTLLEDEIASLQMVAALTHVPSIREAAKQRLAVRRRRLRSKLNNICS